MHDPHFVRDGKRVGCLTNDVRGARRRERTFLLEQFRQRRPIDELHRQIDDPVRRLPEVVDVGDVRMVDATRVRRLAIEATDRVGVLHHRRVHHLEGAPAPHLHVLGEIHLSHTAPAELAQHVVSIGYDRPNEITRGILEPKRCPVHRAKTLIEVVLRCALGADLRTAHALSTRRISLPMRIR